MSTLRKTSPLSVVAKEVLLLIDWENLFFRLFDRFGAESMLIERRMAMLIEWTKQNVGELLGGHGFIFAPEHMSFFHQQICVQNNLRLMTCPKRQLTSPKRNQKTGEMQTEEDTVDETIIWFANLMMRHPNFRFICLVTGDSDFVPLLKEMGEHNIKRALIVPTIDSLSKTKELINLVDRHPGTHKRMILSLDKIAV